MPSGESTIRVKVLGLEPARIWQRQLPGSEQRWGACVFSFYPDERDYDWLVVCNDLPARWDVVVPKGADAREVSVSERSAPGREVLACPREHTLLTTTEPSSIKTYGSAFTAQFAWVLTSQEPWALSHPGRIYQQPALRWFYGVGEEHEVSYDQLAATEPPDKTRDISMVWSGKKQRHTMHNERFRFMQKVRDALPEIDVFGRDVRPLDDKAESLDAFRYHIAIENHISEHHWTEKLADPFLGFTLPFYFGCPNAAAYFPEGSFIPIDIFQPDQAIDTIRAAIRSGEYEKRLPDVIEARRRVLEEYNFFAVVARIIAERHQPRAVARARQVVLSRHRLRKEHPLLGLHHLYEKGRDRVYHWVRRERRTSRP